MEFLQKHKAKHVEICLESELRFLAECVPEAVAAGWTKTEWSSAIKKEATEEKKRRKEEDEARERRIRALERQKVLESLPDDVPTFQVGDYAEMADCIVKRLAEEAGGEPPAYHADQLYAYNPDFGLWEQVHEHELSSRMQAWSGRALVDQGEDKKPRPLQVNNVNTPIAFAKALPSRWGRGIEGKTSWLSAGDRGIAFENCFMAAHRAKGRWDIVSLPPGAENRAMYGYRFPLDLTRKSGTFQDFIDSLFDGAEDKEERIALIQEHLGACIMGLAPMFNKALILYGPPGTGKGTFLNIVSQCMPDEPSAVQPKDFDDPQMLASLAKTRLNVVNELSYQDMSDANAVKRIVSGDLVEAKEVYQKPFSFSPDAGHIITANTGQLPSVPNADDAFWDRWVAVPMENRFRDTVDEKRGLVEAITGEDIQGAVSWMIRGAIRLCENNGFTHCPSGMEVIREWEGSASSVAAFISECVSDVTDATASNWPLVSDVYQIYRAWAKMSGYKNPMASRSFSTRINAMGYYKRSQGSRFKGTIKAEARQLIDDYEMRLNRY